MTGRRTIAEKRKRIPEGSVCKPCWELHYCPYGYLVEYFPLLHPAHKEDTNEIQSQRQEAVLRLKSCDETNLPEAVEFYLYSDPGNWEYAQQFDATEIGCRVWGHVCPVFFMQSGATETQEGRSNSRFITREIMLKVVRRDNHVCQTCFQYVPDPEMEFDHIIPVARGGATSVANIRLLCQGCNRKKSDSIDSLLIDR